MAFATLQGDIYSIKWCAFSLRFFEVAEGTRFHLIWDATCLPFPKCYVISKSGMMFMVKKTKPEIKFTYEDYKNAPNDKRYELLEGELIVVPSPKTNHQRILKRLGTLIVNQVEKNGVGEVFYVPFDVVFSEETVLQPDILFVLKKHSHIITEDNIQGAPDLVIEILSEATQDRDRTWKRSLYSKHGVDEYWLVNPENNTVEILKLGEGGYEQFKAFEENQILNSPLLKDLRIDLKKVF
jgi:Uma2 family endonuclease